MVSAPSPKIFRSGRRCTFDQAKLCSYMEMERYHDELFQAQAMCRDPPPNCLCISMAQVKEADRQLFMRISELTKGTLSLRPDGSMPFESHLTTTKNSAHIQFFMIPQPKPSRFAPYTPPKGGSKGKGKGKRGKGEHGGKSDPSKPAVDIPDGCSAMEPASGKPICFPLNRDGCKFAKAGKRCRRGLRICWRCFKEHPFSPMHDGWSLNLRHEAAQSDTIRSGGCAAPSQFGYSGHGRGCHADCIRGLMHALKQLLQHGLIQIQFQRSSCSLLWLSCPLDQLRRTSAPRAGSVSFSTGAFVHAHVPGIRHNTRVSFDEALVQVRD